MNNKLERLQRAAEALREQLEHHGNLVTVSFNERERMLHAYFMGTAPADLPTSFRGYRLQAGLVQRKTTGGRRG